MKSEDIERVLAIFREAMGRDSFDVVDHWEADPTAVGIAAPADHSRLVYVRSVSASAFDATLEVAAAADSDCPYDVVASYIGITAPELVAVVQSHLAPVAASELG